MRILVAGLWARRGINAAALLVIWVAVTAAVLGPIYGRASSEHLVDTRLDARAPYTTGLSFSVEALDELPDDPDAYTAPDPQSLVDEASAAVAQQSPGRYWPDETGWLLDRGGTMPHGATTFQVPLYWRDGMCEIAEVEGSCPSAAGEVLVQRVMAETLGVSEGDSLDLGFVDQYFEQVTDGGRTSTVESERRRQRTFQVVGTYEVTDPESPDWFDLSRFTGIENLVPPPAKGEAAPPATPALLVAPASMDSQTFRVVGTYSVADPESPEWFDLSRFTGIEDLVPPRSSSQPVSSGQ